MGNLVLFSLLVDSVDGRYPVFSFNGLSTHTNHIPRLLVPLDIMDPVISILNISHAIIDQRSDSPEWMALVGVRDGLPDGDRQWLLVCVTIFSNDCRAILTYGCDSEGQNQREISFLLLVSQFILSSRIVILTVKGRRREDVDRPKPAIAIMRYMFAELRQQLILIKSEYLEKPWMLNHNWLCVRPFSSVRIFT